MWNVDIGGVFRPSSCLYVRRSPAEMSRARAKKHNTDCAIVKITELLPATRQDCVHQSGTTREERRRGRARHGMALNIAL